ncbi:MAG TPA: helix-turn-helix domain-containing protein [Candidatus Hydrogenedentes bacterium]|nr:helix-turn-helix domain-containing protein [Candidatus Hydrogenedentota bacterium]
MDKRLAQWLLTRPGDAIETTHAAIAGELGTAREVVSRLLKDFERRHFVAMQRGRVTLTDRGKLGTLAKD